MNKYYKKYLGALLLLVVLSYPNGSAFANTESDNIQSLQQQLTALTKYVQKLTFSLTPQKQARVSDEVLRASIKDGVSWLATAQEQNGHFVYEYLPYEDDYLGGDNIVRQAGALYALSEVARRDTQKDVQTDTAIENAIAYFERISPEHRYEDTDVRCLTKNEENKTCMLGATALALTGVLGYVEANPTKATTYKNLMQGYVSFILESKIPNAGFNDEYRIDIGFRQGKESSFSNGEALLALVRYYQYEQRADVKKVINETFEYLKGKEFDASLYLWAMAAVKDMQMLWPSEMYTTYGKEFTNWRLGLLTFSHGTNRNYCASTEGLVSAYSLLKNSTTEAEQKRLRTEIDFWNTKNIDLQITKEDVYRLAYEDNIFALKKVLNIEQSRGGFLTADDELTQRIDFTQHCVSTYLQTLVDVDGQSL